MSEVRSPKTIGVNMERCRLHVRTLEESLEAMRVRRGRDTQGLPLAIYGITRRLVDVASDAIESFDQERWNAALLCARAAGETAALLFYVVDSSRGPDGERVPDDQLSELVRRVMFGGKVHERMAKPIHVMDALRHASAKLERFEMFYDVLSEYAHPNAIGIYGALTETDVTALEHLRRVRAAGESLAASTGGPFLRVCLAHAGLYLIMEDMLAPQIKMADIAEKWKRELGGEV